MSEAMSESMIPITLTSGQNAVGIACDKITLTWPKSDTYLFGAVIDRKTLSVAASATFGDLSSVPASIKKYDGNNEYLLLVVSMAMGNTAGIPTGDLLSFLDKNGAGPELAKLTQCINTIAKPYGLYSYCLASTMGTETGFENQCVSFGDNSITNIFLPLKLMKINDLYTLVDIFPR